MALLVLLSPSKTQEMGELCTEHSLPEFLTKTEQLVSRLQSYNVAELGRLMAMSEKLAVANHGRFADFRFPPAAGHCRQALLAFRGDVFSEIEADSYTDNDFAFAQRHLRILSGLYGILRPLDLIQPYRLEMGGKFRPTEDQTLYHFWKSDITSSILDTLSQHDNGVLVNLASAEYFKAVDSRKIKSPIVNVHFRERKEGRLRTVAIHAKKARGALANHIIKNKIEQASGLTAFSHNGYTFDRQLSSETELHFIR